MKLSEVKIGRVVYFSKKFKKVGPIPPTTIGPYAGVVVDVRQKPPTVIVQEEYVTWNYDKRPDGTTMVAWMMMKNKKKAVRRTRTIEVHASALIGPAPASATNVPVVMLP